MRVRILIASGQKLQTSHKCFIKGSTDQVHVAGPQIHWRDDDHGARLHHILVLAAYSAEDCALNSRTYEVSVMEQWRGRKL